MTAGNPEFDERAEHRHLPLLTAVSQRSLHETLGRRFVEVLATLMVLALWTSWLLPLTVRAVAAVLGRLSFIPYLAGSREGDVQRFARHLILEMRSKRRRHELSNRYLRGWVATLLVRAWLGPARRRRLRSRAGVDQQAFAILSPSAACNLRCTHCYASASDVQHRASTFEEVSQVVAALDVSGTDLVLLSGGEPLLWREGNENLFTLIEQHRSMLFVVYSNGTLIDRAVAERFRDAGNVLLLLSVEGLERETDAVRGEGTFAEVHRAMDELKRAGVLFGVSVTASRANAETIASPRFMNELLDEGGASFVWVLDLAPLGRADSQLVLAPSERDELQTALNEEMNRGRLVVSFLHTELCPTGCFGARRFDGFFYLDWERVVRRCVYQPTALLQGEALLRRPGGARELVALGNVLTSCELGHTLERPPPGSNVSARRERKGEARGRFEQRVTPP